MPQTVGRGGTITLDAIYRDGTGTAVDPVDPKVTIVDPSEVEQITNDDPTRNPSVGRYEYDYAVDVAAELGVWTITWTGTINGVAVEGAESFEVVDAGEVGFTDEAFATVGELSAHIGLALEVDDAAALQALRSATAAIRGYTRQTISRVANDAITLDGSGTPLLLLPQLPVESVASITLEDEALVEGPTEDYTLGTAGILWREGGGTWGTRREGVAVVYTHGYDDVPDEIRGVCLDVAARILANPEAHEREQIGTYGVGYARSRLTEDDKQILDAFRITR